MTELEKRLAQLERRADNHQKQLEELTAREQARRISSGQDAPHHIGNKTKEVLIQEIYSLINTKPQFRKPDYDEQVLSKWRELSDLVGENKADSAVDKLYRYIAERENHIIKQLKSRSPA